MSSPLASSAPAASIPSAFHARRLVMPRRCGAFRALLRLRGLVLGGLRGCGLGGGATVPDLRVTRRGGSGDRPRNLGPRVGLGRAVGRGDRSSSPPWGGRRHRTAPRCHSSCEVRTGSCATAGLRRFGLGLFARDGHLAPLPRGFPAWYANPVYSSVGNAVGLRLYDAGGFRAMGLWVRRPVAKAPHRWSGVGPTDAVPALRRGHVVRPNGVRVGQVLFCHSASVSKP